MYWGEFILIVIFLGPQPTHTRKGDITVQDFTGT